VGISLSIPSITDPGGYQRVIPATDGISSTDIKEFIVPPSGVLQLPGLKHGIPAAGRSRAEIEAALSTAYNALFNEPMLTVSLLQSRNVAFVQGEVKQQQVLPLEENGTSLADALAGGQLDRVTADISHVYVIRPPVPGSELQIYHTSLADAGGYAAGSTFALRPLDTVYVATRPITNWNRLIGQLFPSGFSNVIDPLRYE
jgi:hypothetical protein